MIPYKKIVFGLLLCLWATAYLQAQVVCDPPPTPTITKSTFRVTYGSTRGATNSTVKTSATMGQPLVGKQGTTPINRFGYWAAYLVPPPPPALQAYTNASLHQIELSWTTSNPFGAPATDGYRLKRDGKILSAIDHPSTQQYIDKDITLGESYTYTIVAVNQAGGSREGRKIVTAVTQDKLAQLAPYPTSQTTVCVNTTATLILENVGVGEEVVWYAVEDPTTPIYESNSQTNSFQPLVTQDTVYYAVIRGQAANACPRQFIRVYLKVDDRCKEVLTAFDRDNDAYIDVSWEIYKYATQAVPNGVFFELKGNGEVLFTSELTETEAATNLDFQDVYRHHLGPNATVNYTITIYRIGFGNVLYSLTTTGMTNPQAQPNLMVTNGDFPDRTVLSWTNTSKLSTRTIIYRDGQQIGQLEDTDVLNQNYVFVDSFSTATNSLMNGQSYNYCIEPFFIPLNQPYSQTCQSGSTFDMDFTASDGTFTNKVSLTWNDISAFADMLEIVADGTVIQTLPSTATSYDVTNIVPGKIVNYGVQIIKNGQAIVTDFDNGNVPPNGIISGRILTQTGNFALANVGVALEITVLGTLVRDTVYTENNGFYEFEALYYGAQASVKLTPFKPDFTFSPAEKLIPLNTLQPQKTGINFLQVENFQEDTTLTFPIVALTNAQATPQSNQHGVLVTFTYSASNGLNPLNFNIKRGPTLLDVVSSTNTTGTITYLDTTGIPNANYDYEILAYGFFDVDGTGDLYAIKDIAITPLQFPAVMPIENLAGNSNDNKEIVELTWTYPASNYEGFKIRRNGVLIATLPPNAIGQYEDYSGSPEAYIYSVSAFRTVAEVDYESTEVITNSINYPGIPAPANFTATQGADRVLLNWELPPSFAPLDPDYNFTGFQLFRNEVLIGVVYRGFPLTYTDFTGIPSETYVYKINAFRALPNTTVTSNFEMATRAFPVVSAPSGMMATDGTADFLVALNWTKPANTENLDGYIVYFEGDSIATISIGQTSFAAFADHATPMTYEVKAYRQVGGQIYTSMSSSDNGQPNLTTVGLAPITNFKASDDLADQVVLTWAYPSFVLANFTVYRDGNPIGTVQAGNQKYCDLQATVGQNHLYQIQGEFMGELSDKAADYGKVRTGQRISGIVASTNTQRGMPNIRIMATGTNFQQFTYTDSAGAYCLDDIPLALLGSISLSADETNGTYVENPKTVTEDGAAHYLVNFQNNFEPTLLEVTSPAVVNTLNLSGIDCPSGIKLSWTTTNNNYDGFEVMRGVKTITLIQKGQALFYEDSLASPGVLQTYQVRAYLDGETRREYTIPYSNAFIIKNLAPVASLDANVIAGGNAFDIVWSHPCNEHTYYKLERNGEIVGLISTDSALVYRDSTGIPGNLYTYTVTSVWINQGEVYQSDPVNLTINYPNIGRVENLVASIPSTSERITLEGPLLSSTNTNYTLNQVVLTWNHTSDYCDGFAIYRGERLIATLDCDTRTYIDFYGIPGASSEYSVRTLLQRGSLQLEAEGRKVQITYPIVQTVYGFGAYPNNQDGYMQIFIRYPTENMTGYTLYRGPSQSNVNEVFYNGTTYDVDGTLNIHIDKTGIPGQLYYYGIEFYTIREGQIYRSAKVIQPRSFVFSRGAGPPRNLIASEYNAAIPLSTYPVPDNEIPYYDAVHLSWEYDINRKEIDGFHVEREDIIGGTATWNIIADVGKETRKLVDYPHDFPTISSNPLSTTYAGGNNYRVRTYVLDSSGPVLSTFLSLPSNVDNGSARLGRTDIADYTDFNAFAASDGTSDEHVVLSWNNGVTNNSNDILLYRDSTLIVTQPYNTFTYNDSEAIPGKKYLYSIRYRTGGKNYYSDRGYSNQVDGKSIHGTVKTLTGNAPVEGVSITTGALVHDDFVIRKTTKYFALINSVNFRKWIFSIDFL